MCIRDSNRRNRLSKPQKRYKNNNEVNIIIPARNEEKRLPHLLQTLNQQQDIAKIIVMDDGSTDQTVAIAQNFGKTVYQTHNDTNGLWYGKSHACYQGAKHAKTSLLMFIDADVSLTISYSIETILETYQLQHNRGLLSIQPYHQTYRFYESLSEIFNLMTVVGMNGFSSLARHNHQKMAFGLVTLMNREDYFATQGHQNARNSIIEGFA